MDISEYEVLQQIVDNSTSTAKKPKRSNKTKSQTQIADEGMHRYVVKPTQCDTGVRRSGRTRIVKTSLSNFM